MTNLQYSQETMSEVYTRLLGASNSHRIEILLKLMLVVIPSTAECERGFSCMKLIKTHTRNTMTQETLQLLMTVKQLGPSLANFIPDKAISHWMSCGKGGRHLGRVMSRSAKC